MDLGLVRDIVRLQLPGTGADSIRRLGEGQEHAAYEVDGRVVVRFALDHDGCSPRIAVAVRVDAHVPS
jgi:hypothetical protein